MLCRLLQQSQGRLRRHVHQAVMSVQVMRSKCKRLGGQPAQGAAINGLGCTGACLRWAARLIQNPPTFEDTLGWGAWHGVEPADVASFSAVCSEVNKLGCAYLHWDVVNFHGGPGDVLAAEWLSAAHECYAHFLQSVDEDIVAVLCPDVPEIFKSLQHVHQNCWTVSSVVYTLHCEVVEPDSLCVRATTLNGDLVSEVVLGREVPLNSWKHVPEPFFRIAEDGNVYTRKEFEDYYGHKAYDRWASALPCYEHAIAVIVDAGAVSHLTAVDFLHRRTQRTSSYIYR